MRRVLALFLAACLCMTLLGGCGTTPAADGRPRIVVTIYPVYDWVLNLLGERAAEVDVTLLLSDGVDMHSFQPTVEDIVKVSSCDLLIYVGGESDEWIEDALSEAVNPEIRALNLLDVLGERAREEELTEGMSGEADGALDEHVWLSLQNARVLCAAISDALRELDPGHDRAYDAALAVYDGKLAALDTAYQAAVDAAKYHTLLFADRFPFRYLTEDYGLDYYAAFSGCSAETEASFATVAFLAGKLDELGLPAVLVIESADGRLAQTVVQSTAEKNQKILTLHSMQGSTNGASYLELMERNLNVLKEALN